MHKNTQHLHGGFRAFAAAAAIASLAAFGCSTNRTPGDGQPAVTAPSMPSSTPGTSSGTNPPMASAYSTGVSIDRANESAAIMAAHQRERFLGTINPSDAQPNPAQPAQQPTGQFVPPSAYANPQATVNASISSDPVPVVTGDLGGAVVIGSTGTTATPTVGATTATTVAPTIAATTATPTTAAITTTPTLTNTTATPTTAAITTTPTLTNTTLTPTTAAIATTTNSAAAGAGTTVLTPTLTSSVTPSPTRAANPPLASLRLSQAATTTTTASSTTASTSAVRTAGTGRVVAPIRVVTNANGTVTVTNMTSTPPTVITNHQ